MALDAAGLRHDIPTVLAGIRSRLVAYRLRARRSRSEDGRSGLERHIHAMRRGHTRVHQLLSVLRRDAAHDWV